MRRDNEMPGTELTAPHRKLVEIIQQIGFEVLAEYAVGPYMLDCYLPEFHVGIEADGPGHSRVRDAKRDGVLCDLGIPVLRLGTALIEQEPEDARKYIVDFAQDFQDDVVARREISKQYERMYQ
jgi:very-short-patch-repair endonuclease